MADNTSQELEQAIKGLLYSSESDSPFKVVHWAKREATLSIADLRSLAGKGSNAHIAEVSLDEFFHDLTQDQKWHDAEDKKIVERYRNLLVVLKRTLGTPKVFKIGDTEIEIYIIGPTTEGGWAGIRTKAVET